MKPEVMQSPFSTKQLLRNQVPIVFSAKEVDDDTSPRGTERGNLVSELISTTRIREKREKKREKNNNNHAMQHNFKKR